MSAFGTPLGVAAEFTVNRTGFLSALQDIQTQAQATAKNIQQAFAANPISIPIAINTQTAMTSFAEARNAMQSTADEAPVVIPVVALGGGLQGGGGGQQAADAANDAEAETDQTASVVAEKASPTTTGRLLRRFQSRLLYYLAFRATAEIAEIASDESRNEILNAGDTRARATQELKDVNRLEDIPIAGQIAKLAVDPYGNQQIGAELAMREASNLDAQSQAMVTAGEQRQRQAMQADVATTPGGYERQQKEVENKFQLLGQENLKERQTELDAATKVHEDNRSEIVLKYQTYPINPVADYEFSRDPANKEFMDQARADGSHDVINDARKYAQQHAEAQERAAYQRVVTGIDKKWNLDSNDENLTPAQKAEREVDSNKILAQHDLAQQQLTDARDVSNLEAEGNSKAAARLSLVDKQAEAYAKLKADYLAGNKDDGSFDASDTAKNTRDANTAELAAYDAKVARAEKLKDFQSQEKISAGRGESYEGGLRASAAEQRTAHDNAGAEATDFLAKQTEMVRVGMENVASLRAQANATNDAAEKTRLSAEADALAAKNKVDLDNVTREHAAQLKIEAEAEASYATSARASAQAIVQRAQGQTADANATELKERQRREMEDLLKAPHTADDVSALKQKQSAETQAVAIEQHRQANDAIESARQTLERRAGLDAVAEREAVKYKYEGQYGITGKGAVGGEIGAAGGNKELIGALKTEEHAELAATAQQTPKLIGNAMADWTRTLEAAGSAGKLPGLNPNDPGETSKTMKDAAADFAKAVANLLGGVKAATIVSMAG